MSAIAGRAFMAVAEMAAKAAIAADDFSRWATGVEHRAVMAARRAVGKVTASS